MYIILNLYNMHYANVNSSNHRPNTHHVARWRWTRSDKEANVEWKFNEPERDHEAGWPFKKRQELQCTVKLRFNIGLACLIWLMRNRDQNLYRSTSDDVASRAGNIRQIGFGTWERVESNCVLCAHTLKITSLLQVWSGTDRRIDRISRFYNYIEIQNDCSLPKSSWRYIGYHGYAALGFPESHAHL